MVMRRFFGGGKPSAETPTQNNEVVTPPRWPSVADSRNEKIILQSARSFGVGVQTIVSSAKSKSDDSWKAELLDLLENNSDIKTLLEIRHPEFCKLCVEQDLPPNLVHCLRLLRVLELQNDHTVTEKSCGNCTKLLQKLCVDRQVGEQLRPHLFGLLALSGASYPASGVLIAKSASTVIQTFAENCLSPNLVWFIKDRKMILHMTDDVKELTGVSSNNNAAGLVGAAAEEAGLWDIAISTIVKILYESTKLGCMELVLDFGNAGGYDVVAHAIVNAKTSGMKLVEILPMLSYCGTEKLASDEDIDKLVCNRNILDLIGDLLTRSNPILIEKRKDSDLVLSAELTDIEQMVKDAIGLATRIRNEDLNLCDLGFDLGHAVNSIILQLFADHPNNYEILESKLNVMSYTILAFPCFTNADTKRLILKIVELTLTAVEMGNFTTPLECLLQIFFQMVTMCLAPDHPDWLAEDMDVMSRTLEKLLEFDQRVADLLLTDSMTAYIDSVLKLLGGNVKATLPPVKTPRDKAARCLCRFLRLLVLHQPSRFEVQTFRAILETAIFELGMEATKEAASVFENFMGSYSNLEILMSNMEFALSKLADLGGLILENRKNASLLRRTTILVGMLKSLAEEKSLGRLAFRKAGGFDVILKLILKLENVSDHLEGTMLATAILEFFAAVFGLLDAVIGMKSRAQLANEISPLSIESSIAVDWVSSQLSDASSASSMNRNYIRQNSFYLNLAAVLAGTGLLDKYHEPIINLAMAHMDPDLHSQKVLDSIRNPDAIRLNLGLAVFTDKDVAIQILDKLLRLSEHDRIATTLPKLASCGLAYSLTSQKEFGSVLLDDEHPLQSRFYLLLNRVASFHMSYMDFVSILRNIAGPLLRTTDGQIRLPVISSSIQKNDVKTVEAPDAVKRLSTICEIAKNADEHPRLKLGGDSVNTIAVLMHEVKLEDRLRAAAEEGRLRYLEVEKIEMAEPLPDKLWTPLVSTGFTFSAWMRHDVPIGSGAAGNLHIFDVWHIPNNENTAFLSVWYDLQNQRFNVMSSASYRGEPTCFPVSPLLPGVWHHVMITYTPAKRSMIARKSAFALYVDGRALEAEIRVDSVSLPPNSRFTIGAPNPALAVSGVVRGILPIWELGPAILLSTVLLDLDSTALYAYGPGFPGLLWGDRPQSLSLAATGTALFTMLSGIGEVGSIASALKRREVRALEGAGYSSMGHTKKDDLAAVNLLCSIPADSVIFGFQAATISGRLRNEAIKKESKLGALRLVNLARLNYSNEIVATDAIVFGKGSAVVPLSFKDCMRWVGGPAVLMPLVNAASSSQTLSLALQMVRLGCEGHRPNLEMLQAGGVYRVLSVLLQSKDIVDEACLDQCLAFAIHGFNPEDEEEFDARASERSAAARKSRHWVFSDLDAMKYLLLNHQVWDLRKYGPGIPLRLLASLNLLVDHRSTHKTFNARRLHQVGIVRWALHLAIEAAELYSNGEISRRRSSAEDASRMAVNSWSCECPRVGDVSVGGDPGNPFLLECKNLLRRVLTFMLTPSDLEALVEAVVFTSNIGSSGSKSDTNEQTASTHNSKMMPGSTLRLHLIRLLEELIVDGVNEIVATGDVGGSREEMVLPHNGGVASPNQPYFSTAATRGILSDGRMHPKHQQAQNFLSAFASFLTPIWFATVLEGCQEEASASAILRLMVLMVQGSTTFEASFNENGAFSPFVLSVPSYSTCPGVTIAMLSELLNVPVLHLHSLPTLDAEQLCEVFDSESMDVELAEDQEQADPSNSVFALLVECLGRNVTLTQGDDSEVAAMAAATNRAVVQLLAHRHSLSSSLREYCRTKSFLEPLAQALCLVYNEKLQPTRQSLRSRRPSLLSDVPKDLTPTERFIGSVEDPDSTGMGIVRLIRMIVSDAVDSGPLAAKTVYTIFRGFPIHASAQQVEAFHLVLIEQCCSVIDGILQRRNGHPLSLANCIGICSVFLDHAVGGFFTSEAALKAVKIMVTILEALLRFDTPAIYSLANSEHSILARDSAYLANLMCVTSLRIALPYDMHDKGDEDLQATVLQVMDKSISLLLLLPSRDRKSNWKVPTARVSKPATNSRLYEIWRSASIVRSLENRQLFFPDNFSITDVDSVSIAPLLVSLRRLLLGGRDDVRSLAIAVFVSLLQHRSTLLHDLLVTEVKRGGKVEIVDVVNRGGFKALMTAHEAASVSTTNSSTKRKYAAFFDWFDKNQEDVQLVFDSVDKLSLNSFPGLIETSNPQEETIEKEQKLMLVRLSAGSTERAMAGGFERAMLSSRCVEKTSDLHSQWKRQGFDNLAYGAMKWKVLLRQLKGSSSIWEGGLRVEAESGVVLEERLRLVASGGASEPKLSTDLVKRWKLDLTEGYERQRRRLLPNYEFHGLYNVEEEDDGEPQTDVKDFIVGGGQMEATAALLKDLNIKRSKMSNVDDLFDESENDPALNDSITEASTLATQEAEDPEPFSDDAAPSSENAAEQVDENGEPNEEKESSSYELITGLLQAGDWPDKSYNVNRCTGLEVTKALFLWCKSSIYVIDGFEQTGGDDIEGKISRVERERSSFHINLRPKGFSLKDEEKSPSTGSISGTSISKREASRDSSQQPGRPTEIIYEHRSQRMLMIDLHSVYRRRYQLQQNALEFYDVDRNSVLIAFATHEDREEVLSFVLQSNIPNSVFSSGYGTFSNYTKFMRNWKAKLISQWQGGKLTNFEFLMELNSLAGRSFNDLTQYPVFPWVIADYDSEEIDLDDPKSYRDLSKPMGALGEQRAQQFRDRYDALASTYFGEDDPPPFHYGTHYSCAAYVLYYLMRLEPFSRLALALQGGRFDVADRLFHDVGKSWRSASCENLQDVRELIPEFYYLPDFLENTNHFDFGETQRGKAVHDVTLPKWAKGDPKRFVRINRQALESDYVSEHLHHWIDLVFGYKQRGEEALKALNSFVHVTYEDEVDIDSMEDPIQRQSTIAQIQNFGQTPSRLERYPFPHRTVGKVLKEGSIDFGVVAQASHLTPPLCVAGAPHRVHMTGYQSDSRKLGVAGQLDSAVGDICYIKSQILGTGRMCALLAEEKKYYRFGGLNNGITMHAAAVTARYREVNKIIGVHDDLHRGPVSASKASRKGDWIVTGSVDSTVRVWAYNGNMVLRATLCGHDGSRVTCIDISTECGIVVSGCSRGRVLLWDLRTLTFVRPLRQPSDEPTLSVSINHKNGNVVTLVGDVLTVFDVNGNLVAQRSFAKPLPCCAVSTDCPEWMDQGVAVVTGHENGAVNLWSILCDEKTLVKRHTLEGSQHSTSITALRVTGLERQDTLLVGDSAGRISVYKTTQLDAFSPEEVMQVAKELSAASKTSAHLDML